MLANDDTHVAIVCSSSTQLGVTHKTMQYKRFEFTDLLSYASKCRSGA